MPRKRLLLTLFTVVGAFSIHAQGLFWSASSWQAMSSSPGMSWEIAFDHVSANVGYPPSLNPVTRIFSMSLGTNDAGQTFYANALNEPLFSGFAAGLTDGVNGYIRIQAPDYSGWSSSSEQEFLGRPLLAPDLAGYNITQIGFRVDDFYDSYNASEDRYFRRLNYSLDFYGAPVPEPSTWALLGLGGAAALLVRREVRRLRRT